MRANFITALTLVIGVPFAYAIIGDWDRSGSELVRMLFGVILAALVTVVIVAFLRYKRPDPVQPPPKPEPPPFDRRGNIIFTMPPGTMPQGLMPYNYGDQPQAPTYHPSQLID